MHRLLTSLFILCVLLAGRAGAADPATLKASIAKGAKYLQSRIPPAGNNYQSLMALAFYKAGNPVDSPELQQVVKSILACCSETKYQPQFDHVYQAGVHATLLADLDPQLYKPQLALIAAYLQENQLANGGWDYPVPRNRPGCLGDTSVTQYACLGLWAAQRAGVEIDPHVWVNILNWHVTYQNTDGGYAYCPKYTEGLGHDRSMLNMTVNAIGSMHIAMLQLDPEMLPLRQKDPAPSETPADKRKFGVLDEVKITVPNEKKPAKIPPGAVPAVRKAFAYLISKFEVENKESQYKTYYYYSLERMGALANVRQVGDHDWFNECADFVISQQLNDGSWQLATGGELDTAFCLLFLTRSTAKILNRKPKEPEFGEGTLAGGRGLPENLGEAQFDGRKLRGKEEAMQPLDQLFASLRNTGEIDLDQAQDQIVQQVQLGDRNLLIGQIDQIVKLASNRSPDVRKTALWAIGRSDRIDLGTLLIKGLDDPDLGVIIEARNALCWLSRKPAGFGEAEDPLLALPADASEQQKRDAIAAWHRQLVINWGKWYLDHRPFDERGDRFEADFRARIQQLQGTVTRP